MASLGIISGCKWLVRQKRATNPISEMWLIIGPTFISWVPTPMIENSCKAELIIDVYIWRLAVALGVQMKSGLVGVDEAFLR